MNTEDTILSLEKEALDQWSGGNPGGYFKHGAQDFTYFDDIGAQNRMNKEEFETYGERTLKEMIPPHKYEMRKSKLQDFGNTAILTYFYHPFDDDGKELTIWRASVVYINLEGVWKIVHAHWTMQKPQ